MSVPPMHRSTRRRAAAPAALACGLAAVACSGFQPTFTAEHPGPGGTRPVPVLVYFEGDRSLSRTDLGRAVEDAMFDVSQEPTREAAADDAAWDLAELYRSAGFPDVRVDHERRVRWRGDGEPRLVEIRFRIDEGPQCTVETLEVHGNTVFADADLLALWHHRRAGILGLGKPLFVESQLEALARDLATYHRERGHLDVDVGGPEVQRNADGTRAWVRYTVEEGPRYRFGDVRVIGEIAEVLGADASPQPSEPAYSESRLQELRGGVRRALRRAGHPDPTLRVTVDVDAARHEVDVLLYGEPGVRARVEEVAVRGNERTATWVIRGALALGAGDRFDGDAEDRAVERLYRKGLFRRVTVHHEAVDGDPSRLRLVLEVDEDPSREISVLAGWGSYEQLRAGAGFEERNLFGTGRALRLDAKLSTRGHEGRARLTDFDLLGGDTILTFEALAFERERPSFVDRGLGGSVALSRELGRGVTATVGYSLADRSGSQDPDLLDPSLESFQEGRVFLDLIHNLRDNVLFPRRGSVVHLSFDVFDEALGADVDFMRLRGGLALYVPLAGDLRAVLRSEHGALWPGQGSGGVPIQERFFNGGHDTVRSFDEDRLGPRDGRGDAVGGEFANTVSAELRFPIVRTLEGALFWDAGNVGRRVEDYGFDDLEQGIGGGLRLVLPIGPVRVDGAWNPDPGPGDDDFVIHLSVGYPF